MATSFPLYDTLAKEALDNPTAINIKNLAATFSQLSEDHATIIYLLIQHHAHLYAKNNVFIKIPYSGNVLPGGKGVIFPATSLPPSLLIIIYKYLEHCQKQ